MIVNVAHGPLPFLVAVSLIGLLMTYHHHWLDRSRRAELAASENRYRAIAETVDDMIFEIDERGVVVYANPSIRQIGYTPEQIIGRNGAEFLSHVSAEDAATVWQKVEQNVQTLQPLRWEVRFYRPDGHVLWLDVSLNRLHGRGQMDASIFVVRDITERKRGELELRASETLHRRMIGAITDYIYLFRHLEDNREDKIYVSNAIERLLGYSPDALLTNPDLWVSLIHPDDQAAAHAQYVRLIGGESSETEYRLRRADGEYIWVRDSAQPEVDPNTGDMLVYGVVSNIAARKALELELRASEERYRIIAETISDYAYLFRVEPDGTIVLEWITGAFERITGYSLAYVQQHGLGDMVLPEDVPQMRAQIATMLATGQPVDGEFRLKNARGEVRWMHVFRKPIRDEAEGRVVRFYGVVQDITERKQAEKQKVALALERERFGILGGFVRDLSHDIRTPLSLIGTSVDLLRRKLDSANQDKAARHLNTIEAQIVYLDHQLQSLLSVTQRDHLPRRQFAPVNLNTVTQAVLTDLEENIHSRGLRVNFTPASALPTIYADAEEIRRAVWHLVVNAVSYTDGRDGCVELATCNEGDKVKLIVRDSGIGIAPDDLPHIFEPLFRADRARQIDSGGMGLGLSVVKMIVEAHGGEIAVASELGVGSVFTVTFPNLIDAG